MAITVCLFSFQKLIFFAVPTGHYMALGNRMCTRTPERVEIKSLDQSLADCSSDPKCIGVRDISCKGLQTTKCYMPNTKKPFPYSSSSCVHENPERGH